MSKKTLFYTASAILVLTLLLIGIRSAVPAELARQSWQQEEDKSRSSLDSAQKNENTPVITAIARTAALVEQGSHPALMHLEGDGLFLPDDGMTLGELTTTLGALFESTTGHESVGKWLREEASGQPDTSEDGMASREDLVRLLGKLSTWLTGEEAERAKKLGRAVQEGTLLTDKSRQLTRREIAVVLVKLSGREPDEGRLILGEALPEDVLLQDEAWVYVADAVTEGEIPRREEGVYRLHGWLYAADEKGNLIRNRTFGVWSFDQDGRYTTGDSALDQSLQEALTASGADMLEGDEALKAVYLFVKNNFEYMVTPEDMNPEAEGSTGWEFERAARFFRYGGGTCYGYAAVFGLLARCLGENAQIVAATVNQFNGPHSFVVIADDSGTDWIYDVELEDTRPERHGDFDLYHIQNYAIYNYWYTPTW